MARVIRDYREFAIGLAGLAAVMIAFGLAAGNRFGSRTADDSCFTADDGCYCENISRPNPNARAVVMPQARRALIRQPLNTWSNLGFIGFGLAMLWVIGWERAGTPSRLANRMTQTAFYPAAFGFMTIFMGPGSMFFHGSLKRWGGWLDSVSMYLFMSFILVYNLTRFWNWPRPAWGVAYAGLNLLFAWMAWIFREESTNLFAALGGLALISQVMVARTDRIGTATSGHWWFFAGVVSFLLAFTIWRLSWTGAPLCAPRGFQGHAVWHVLTAFTVFCVYKYFRAESRVVSPLPKVLRILVGVVLGGGLGAGAMYLFLQALGAGVTASAVVAAISGALGAAYAGLALAYNVYTFRFMSALGLVLDVTWSLLNTAAGLLVWIPAAAISKAKFLTPDPDSRRSGCFVYDKNPRGGGFAATTIGTVVAGGWSSHEEIHVWQARIFGPLYMITYVLSYGLNVLFRLLTFRKSNLITEPYHRICFEDWAYWAGALTGRKIKWGYFVAGFFLCVLFVGLVVMVIVGAATGTVPVLVTGIVGLVVYSLVRALLPPSH